MEIWSQIVKLPENLVTDPRLPKFRQLPGNLHRCNKYIKNVTRKPMLEPHKKLTIFLSKMPAPYVKLILLLSNHTHTQDLKVMCWECRFNFLEFTLLVYSMKQKLALH